jgi:hypothetical protein
VILAKTDAIAATGQAIVGMLNDALLLTDFADTEISLVMASQFQEGKPLAKSQGLSVYLYRLAPDASTRNLPPRTTPEGKRYRPSLPVNLHYLITPWALNAFTQHRLLGWAIRVLEDASTLPAGLLNHYTALSPDATEIFRDEETVDLILEPLTAQELANIMEVFKAQGQLPPLSVSYIARVLILESNVQYADRAPVVTRQFEIDRMRR